MGQVGGYSALQVQGGALSWGGTLRRRQVSLGAVRIYLIHRLARGVKGQLQVVGVWEGPSLQAERQKCCLPFFTGLTSLQHLCQ